MRAANQSFDSQPFDNQPFDNQPFDNPLPDQATVAGFDALLASLDPETARLVLRECLDEIALWQHHLRVQESHYASEDGQPRALFRIG